MPSEGSAGGAGGDALVARYDAIWAAGAAAVRAGRAEFDPWLGRRGEDPRRGLTLVARPAPEVAGAVAAFTAGLCALEPTQFYQPRADLHHTVLSLFTATPDPAPHLARLTDYREGVAEALDGAPAFAVASRGVTLSPGAVLVQGFPGDGTLAAVRDRLRAALAARGLGGSLDRRYRLETAHLTAARFAAPLRDPAAFVDALAAARGRAFGTTRVTALALVVSDWYHAAAREEVVAEYRLGGVGAPDAIR